MILLVLDHDLDGRCVERVAGYRNLLQDPAVVVPVTMWMVTATLRAVVQRDERHEQWLRGVEDRYLIHNRQ